MKPEHVRATGTAALARQAEATAEQAEGPAVDQRARRMRGRFRSIDARHERRRVGTRHWIVRGARLSGRHWGLDVEHVVVHEALVAQTVGERRRRDGGRDRHRGGVGPVAREAAVITATPAGAELVRQERSVRFAGVIGGRIVQRVAHVVALGLLAYHQRAHVQARHHVGRVRLGATVGAARHDVQDAHAAA